MGFFDSIFGGESTKGIKFQREDNKRRQKFVEEQAALGRQDVLNIVPRGTEALQQGYRAAEDVLRRGPQAQIRTLQRSSQRAQEPLLQGMNEYRRAIMGLPSQMDPNNPYENPLGLKPIKVGGGAQPAQPFYGSQSPLFLGTPQEDRMEAAIRSNPSAFLAMLQSSPEILQQAIARAPEQFRQGVRYDFESDQTTGGVIPNMYQNQQGNWPWL